MFISVIIVGGGAGTRFGRQNKLFAEINGIPVFIHSIRNFIGSCNQMIMAVPQAMIDDFSRTAEQFFPENHFYPRRHDQIWLRNQCPETR